MNPLLQRTRFAAAGQLLALAACGGGGGEADPGATPPPPPLERNDPRRDWTFSVYSSSATTGITRGVVPGLDGSGTQVGGLLEQIAGFGETALLDDELFLLTEVIPPEGQDNGLVFSTGNGKTYGVFAEAPSGKLAGSNGAPDRIGGNASLLQSQSFIKRAADASLSFTLTDVLICAYDFNAVPPFGGDNDRTPVRGAVLLSIQAWTSQVATRRVFFSVSGGAALVGTRDRWTPFVQDFADGFSFVIWERIDFDVTTTAFSNEFGNGTQGCLENNVEITYPIDLSSIAIGEEFTVQSIAEADAINKRGGGAPADHQAAGVSAYLRDPSKIGGTTMVFAGLEPTNRPDLTAPARTPVTPASCLPGPGLDPAAGVIQFSAAGYTTDESPGSLPTITVTRTGGSRGAVTATFTTSDGTAIAGADYTPVSTSVFFRDGDATPRVVVVPILGDRIVEPIKTLNLRLSQPGGCAAMGPQTTAVLSIEDDDQPPPTDAPGALDTTFGNAGKAASTAFGGDRSTMALQVDGKIVMVGGTFTDFILARFNGNGSLDASFGVGGRVTTDMVSGQQEEALGVAIQSDGKIVVVGYTRPGLGHNIALARYNADGSLDTGFGSGGKLALPGALVGEGLALQRDGKLVLVGSVNVGSGVTASTDFALMRLNSNGSPDDTFGSAGTVTTAISTDRDGALAVALQADGKIVVAGTTSNINANFAVARYNANGTLDTSFGNGFGVLAVDFFHFTDIAESVLLQPDGKIVVGGLARDDVDGYGLARLNP